MASPKILHGLEIKFGNIYGPEEEAAVLRVLHQNAPTSGDACIQFERDFAAYCGSRHARAVSNGTAALFLSMIGIGIKPGDRVLTTPLTWIATAAAAATLGADVDFVDVDPETYNLDPVELRRKLEDRSKAPVRAVVPVHLYGRCCDMDALGELSREFGFAIVEDACHAVGADHNGRKAGSMGATGCFSFHEQKNMSTLGEGGMVVTDDPAIFERVALYRSHCTRVYGASTKYCSIDESLHPMGKRFWGQDFDDVGYNFRMTDIQAAVGIEQLRKLDGFNRRRTEIARYLTVGLSGIPGLTLPGAPPGLGHVWHLYPIEIDAAAYGMNREDFLWAMLHERGIKAGTHYAPLNLMEAFRRRGFGPGMFPVAEALAGRLVTLPINPRLTTEALDYLIESVRMLCRA